MCMLKIYQTNLNLLTINVNKTLDEIWSSILYFFHIMAVSNVIFIHDEPISNAKVIHTSSIPRILLIQQWKCWNYFWNGVRVEFALLSCLYSHNRQRVSILIGIISRRCLFNLRGKHSLHHINFDFALLTNSTDTFSYQSIQPFQLIST